MAGKMSSGLPTPPTEECKPVLSTRRSSTKSAKSSSRGSKRNSASAPQEPKEVVMDGRHKRVWKACERCRMKKTKCDGESPCKRCKDDGLVCTAGSRKKTEFKQLPRGYAEVLENTQYALIATVQKLYTMVRNGESWELGEPELNDRGLPVIHNIAEKLGCIRPSPDMPQTFPEDAEEFAELQAQLFAGKLESCDGKRSEDSMSHRDRNERASSSDSEHSTLSKDYTQMLWAQQQQQRQQQANLSLSGYQAVTLQFGDEPLFQTDYVKQESAQSICDASSLPTTSPVYSTFNAQSQLQSPVFRTQSPFSPWSPNGNTTNEDFLGPSHILDITALYMRQQQQQSQQQYKQPPPLRIPRLSNATTGMCSPITTPIMESALPTAYSMRGSNSYLAANDGTIRPGMLDCSPGADQLADHMDSIMFGADYEALTMG